MRVRSALFTVATALIAVAPACVATTPAGAAAALPHRTLIGPAQGVQASLSGTTVTVRFTGASAAWGKRRAGKTALVTCEARREPGLLFANDGSVTTGLGATGTGFGESTPEADADAEALGVTTLSATGAAVTAKVDPAQADLCRVQTGIATSADSAWATLTPAGAIGLDERQRALRLADVVHAAAPKGAYRPAAAVVALGGGEVVALDDPNGTPPAGRIGYWSKGRAMSLISAGATGRRLEIQDLGDGMLRTNAFDTLLSWTPAERLKADPDADGFAGLIGDDEDSGSGEDEIEEADAGLFAHLDGDAVVFRFTGKAAKTYRRIAGRRVDVSCFAAPPRPLLGGSVAFGAPATTKVRVPAHGGTLRGRAPAGRRDLCVVETRGGADVATALLSAAGRRYIMDFAAPLLLVLDERAPWDLAPAKAMRYPGVATAVAAHPGLTGLTTPGGPLSLGQIGVWTNAADQATIAFGGPDGLRYVVADEGAGVVRTNAFTTLLGLIAQLYAGASVPTLS